jgi:hypothetical protein
MSDVSAALSGGKMTTRASASKPRSVADTYAVAAAARRLMPGPGPDLVPDEWSVVPGTTVLLLHLSQSGFAIGSA